MSKFRFIPKKKIEKLPKNSGVYCFRDGRKILYIGKAANIRERVKQHKDLIRLATKVAFIKTDSEIEALILEANLIKKYQPKYNVVWRDDKNYFFVGITREDFPQVFWTHQMKLKPNYVGPFVDGKALKETLKVLRRVFPYRSCRVIPKRACLWYHLGYCPAPCLLRSKILEVPEIKEKIKREIQTNANSLFEIIKGRKSRVLRNLKKEMKKMSASQDFERAAKIRDQIKSLEKVLAHAKIFKEITGPQISLPSNSEGRRRKSIFFALWYQIEEQLKKLLKIKDKISRIEAYDVSNIQGQEATGSMVTFINGLPDKNFYRKFKIKVAGKPNDVAMIKECLTRRLNHPEWGFPDLILIDGGIAQLNVALSTLPTPGVGKLKVMALAKKKNELFIEERKKPILLKSLPREVFNLILQLRDEAHRFAISYHKKLREKTLLGD
ncbi:MAG: hypothetical protein COW25_00325 [Candidatus Nealsonbacteria bacterium CG15_BIG_FIL_POST_REV_8_21_14_020_37_12]|uniref:Excinuclease ABC subunit C n=1 Tax=Candidatus Nealsonbacteria bacterium CG15_BIG_FIL_POST_REV_8_21_14_020_37_12 TaxID=1974716 RepID=A0A2M7H1W2_9BACT|nr:MAG: hypothetical protein COW25_00325 [Candidatus Nealsonbacteria bacterium CG15_BIG_FIL_POST_REV_8_21_14_020_37_12]